MEFFNDLTSYKGNNIKLIKECVEKLILMLSPFTPFISDTMWKEIGNEGFTINQKFPEPEEEASKDSCSF